MDRFYWYKGVLEAGETSLATQKNVRLYDGDQKTAFDKGTLTLTTHKIIWTDHNDEKISIALALNIITSTDKIAGGFTRSPKVVLNLLPRDPTSSQGPISHSQHHFIYLSFSSGGDSEFSMVLKEALREQKCQTKAPISKRGAGILGIERGREERRGKTDATISMAFEDLSNLMKKAKEMVVISKSISQKLNDRNSGVSQDEALKFKSYLMSLGIDDPITRDTHGSGEDYFVQLANQISSFILPVLKENNGIITLTDVYCRVNRARGMELLSPEDLERSCRIMDSLNLEMKLRTYANGVKVLQLRSCDEAALAQDTLDLTTNKGSISSDELALIIHCSIILAKQRLLVAEELGKLCRDESNQGLRFYPNLFLTHA